MYLYDTIISVVTVALHTCLWYNLDPELELQTGHSNQCEKYLRTALITAWMGADSALKDANCSVKKM